MTRRIYLDHHATTPVDPRVVEAMLPFFSMHFGNAASKTHVFGWEAEEAVDHARQQIAHLIHADKKEIIFTSGATESDNLALLGIAQSYSQKGNHIITVVTEHKAVLDTCRILVENGFDITYLPVDQDGFIDPDELKKAITPKTILVSVMMANNEIGTIQNMTAIGKITREHSVLFHSDIAQAFGKIPIDVEEMELDLASISGHKIYAPKGIGVLYVRRRTPRVVLQPMIFGGGHEEGFRSGTLNVPGIVALGKASEIALAEMEAERVKIMEFRIHLWKRFLELGDVFVNGVQSGSDLKFPNRLFNNLNVRFERADGEGLIHALKYIAVSTGSACNSANPEPSYVLKAIGLNKEQSRSSLRFGFGRINTFEEIKTAADVICSVVKKLRA